MLVSLSRRGWRELQSREREALCATFERVGPAAPTLCEPWTTSTIAAHLAVSEAAGGAPLGLTYPIRRVVGARATGAALRRLAGVSERVTRRTEARGWAWLLDRLRRGPPALYSLPALARIRFLEAWIHHEDVRRATDPTPRATGPDVEEALVEAMITVARMPEFAVPRRGVRVVLPDGRSFQTTDEVLVTATGDPGEILLWVAGRGTVADVVIEGDRGAITALANGLAF